MIGGMITRLKKVITKNGRSAGMPMGIITMEDLEGQIDGTMFAETFAEITGKYPDAVANEAIVFVRGKIDRKRETPSLLINEIMPIAEALPKLTTDVVLKLDAARHNLETLRQIKPALQSHKGNLSLYLQTESLDGKKVTFKLPKDLSVRPTKALVDTIDTLLGSGTVQLVGAGTRRMRRLQQQALFKETEQSGASENGDTSAKPGDEQLADEMDQEMLQEA
jgi:DNA polymerase-3 subunit alpha